MNRTEYTQELNSFNRRHSYAYTRPDVVYNKAQRNNPVVKDTAVSIPTIKNRIELISSRIKDRDFINQNIARAEEWLAHLIAMIAVVGASLMLIVSGAVLRSKATMELYAAENELKQLQVVQAELEAELELKNDLRYIEMVAKEKLGMIERDHAAVCHIQNDIENKIEIYSAENNEDQEATLLDALSFLQ